tara:strand:- start:638 stop:805 length:168 start_codon:yes stop_codon:yes gene_type:complete
MAEVKTASNAETNVTRNFPQSLKSLDKPLAIAHSRKTLRNMHILAAEKQSLLQQP